MAESSIPGPTGNGTDVTAVAPPPPTPDALVVRLFDQFLAEWTRDTAVTSDAVAILTHPAYYRIIALGRQVLPLIFKDLASGGGPWFVALEAITLENPVQPEHAHDARLMRRDWLDWGRTHGYFGE